MKNILVIQGHSNGDSLTLLAEAYCKSQRDKGNTVTSIDLAELNLIPF